MKTDMIWQMVIVCLAQVWHAGICEKCDGFGTESTSTEVSQNATHILESIFKSYDKGDKPYKDKPVEVTIGIWFLSIDHIDILNMEYRIDIFLRQQWNDPRLSHNFNGLLSLENSMLDSIWLPDTYFSNSKASNDHDVTVPNKMLRISVNGNVTYNTRLTITLSCPMDLHDFPVDTQICEVHMESYAYHAQQVILIS